MKNRIWKQMKKVGIVTVLTGVMLGGTIEPKLILGADFLPGQVPFIDQSVFWKDRESGQAELGIRIRGLNEWLSGRRFSEDKEKNEKWDDEFQEIEDPSVEQEEETEQELPERYIIEKIGVGAGTKDFKNANILRAMILVPEEEEQTEKEQKQSGKAEPGFSGTQEPDSMYVIETNIDDCSGEALGFLMECLLEEGAADVWYTPAVMKKSRPAYVLHTLCRRAQIEDMEGLIFSHTTTIGIRRYPVERTVLNRRVEEMDLPLGKLAVKMCSFRGEERFYPEYESIARISRETGMGFAEVYHLARSQAEEAAGKHEHRN